MPTDRSNRALGTRTASHASAWAWLAALVAFPALSRADEVAFPILRAELVTRAKVDQDLRAHLDLSKPQERAAWKEIMIIDHANTERMRVLVARHGWLTRTMVGEDGAAAAWLLVQHAGDPAFQQRSLQLIDALPEGEVPGESRALLTDRVLLARGFKQRFGSQLESDCRSGFDAKPIDDAVHVDERRAALGMESLASYLDSVKNLYCTAHTEP